LRRRPDGARRRFAGYLKIAQPAWKPLRARLLTIPEAEHAALVSGDTDIVLLVRTRDIAGLRELVLNSFQGMPEVLSTQTVLIFDELGRGTTGVAGHSPVPQRSRR
jgi:DNA-binding Lrp family transcriptional regulator